MARKKNPSLDKAKQYSEFLLFEATGGIIGKQRPKPKSLTDDSKSTSEITFSEKRGLLDSLIKIAIMESKTEEESDSGFDQIRKGLANGSETDIDERDSEEPGGEDIDSPPEHRSSEDDDDGRDLA